MRDQDLHGEAESSFEEIEHTADRALNITGEDFQALFRNAALGMLRLIQSTARAGEECTRTIKLTADDYETLLVSWLEELLFNMETREVTYTGIEIRSLDDCCLIAEVIEKPLERMIKEIKAVTFHDLEISATPDGFKATVVFDV